MACTSCSQDPAYLRQDNACQHVAECQEHGEAEAVSPQQVLVQQHDAYVGRKPVARKLECQSAALLDVILSKKLGSLGLLASARQQDHSV